ncbi:MAG: NFACT family protein [Clostridia bacterium]|nr:NFACT family protein [Clostridia bacterium]
MALDACMLAALVKEINAIGGGGRIEKIYQPERDELILQMRTVNGGRRLLINGGSGNPRIHFTSLQRENPAQAPMLCMLLRKHLNGAVLASVEQMGFERVVRFIFNARDEMGFACKKYIIAEIMGKYSNLIFADENMKIISALKTVDFTTSSLRQVLPGMTYELPPKQDKLDPTQTDELQFTAAFNDFPEDRAAHKFITSTYLGISTTLAREIVYRACNDQDALLCATNAQELFASFCGVFKTIETGDFTPSVVYDGSVPREYCFTSLTHYGKSGNERSYDSLSEAMDVYFADRDKENSIKQRAADILRMLTSAEARLLKKLELQRGELADCERGADYKRYGDLISNNIYRIAKKQKLVEVVDYESWNEQTQDFDKTVIELDERLTPAANAQRYYKLYNKSKNAKVVLADQIKLGEGELEYIYTVFDALAKAETAADITEIRDELYRSGYASKMKGYAASKKPHKPSVAEFRTTNGYRVLCGKNNYQNEYITHSLAEKNDYWFHAKNVAGSHVLLITNGAEPPEQDFTDACEIAAYFSKAANGQLVEVDYLLAKGVKKVSGTKPGFVIYHSNWSAYVTPDKDKIERMRIK